MRILYFNLWTKYENISTGNNIKNEFLELDKQYVIVCMIFYVIEIKKKKRNI